MSDARMWDVGDGMGAASHILADSSRRIIKEVKPEVYWLAGLAAAPYQRHPLPDNVPPFPS